MTSRRPLDNILKLLLYHFASCPFVVPYNYVSHIDEIWVTSEACGSKAPRVSGVRGNSYCDCEIQSVECSIACVELSVWC